MENANMEVKTIVTFSFPIHFPFTISSPSKEEPAHSFLVVWFSPEHW